VSPIMLAKALNEGLRRSLEDDPKVIIMGEDVGKLGGVFRVTDGLQKDFGEARVFDTPLAESGIIGTAVGLAIRGYRPVCEIQFDGFVYPGFDQIVSQVAKIHSRSAANRSTTKTPSRSVWSVTCCDREGTARPQTRTGRRSTPISPGVYRTHMCSMVPQKA